MKNNYILRPVRLSDAEKISEIYAYYVENTEISFEATPPSPDEFIKRIKKITAFYPYLVCERDGRVIAYAYASRHRERFAYRFSADLSVYVDKNETGNGAGKLLYERLFELLKEQTIQTVYASVTKINAKSANFHKKLGFSLCGTFHRVGFKNGKWLDLEWYEKSIGVYPENPEEPHSFCSDKEVEK